MLNYYRQNNPTTACPQPRQIFRPSYESEKGLLESKGHELSINSPSFLCLCTPYNGVCREKSHNFMLHCTSTDIRGGNKEFRVFEANFFVDISRVLLLHQIMYYVNYSIKC